MARNPVCRSLVLMVMIAFGAIAKPTSAQVVVGPLLPGFGTPGYPGFVGLDITHISMRLETNEFCRKLLRDGWLAFCKH